MANKQVLKDSNMESPNQMILKENIKFTHKIISTKQPKNIWKLIKKPTWREAGELRPIYNPKKQKLSKNLIDTGIRLYNTIPEELRKLQPEKLKEELKNWKIYNLPKDREVPATKAKKIMNN